MDKKYRFSDLQIFGKVGEHKYVELGRFSLTNRPPVHIIHSEEPVICMLGDGVAGISSEELATLTNCTDDKFVRHVAQFVDKTEAEHWLMVLFSKKLKSMKNGSIVNTIGSSYDFQKDAFRDGKRDGTRVLFQKEFVRYEKTAEKG